MPAALTRADLLTRLEAGETLLLPTPYAAAQLRAAFDARQRAANIPAWQPASIFAWSQWTQTLWSGLVLEGAEPRLLLNAAQEHTLWREIVAENAAGTLGSPDAMAQLAGSAWQLAAQHHALGRLRATANTHDSRIFAEWAETFARRSTQRGYVSAALLELSLQQHLEMGTLQPPRTLTLAGFLHRTPAQEALLRTLDGRRCGIHEFSLASSASAEPARATTPTESGELTFAARWARSRLEADPSASLAILVPDLSAIRAELEETLRDTLAPQLHSIHAELAAAPWEFTTGPALAAIPLLADALRLAHWAAHALPTDAVTALLLSPYLAQNASESQHSASARFDATILRGELLLRDEIRLSWLLQLAQQQKLRIGDPQPSILAALRDLHTTLQRHDLQRPRSHAGWTELLRDLTRAMGWPGQRALNATEFEATRAWDTLLDTLATLDFAGRRTPYAAFLTELDRQAAATLFHPPALHPHPANNPSSSHPDSEMWASTTTPIQILTPAESIGCSFDAVLLLRATDANFPAAEHVHPLLSWPLQRSLAMPGTDPSHTAARARAFTGDLLHRSGKVLFTHAAQDADGKLRPSSLLAHLPQLATASLVAEAAPADPIPLEAFADLSALPPLSEARIAGGSAVLKLQAACGFLAFAQLRLGATELDTPTLGLDAGQSGTLLHRTLQIFWARIQTQQQLRNLSTEDRDHLLRACIDTALAYRLRPETTWDTAYLALQKERLVAVLLPWLEVELTRGPFEVLSTETKHQVPVGPLTLEVRLDRLDRIPGTDGQTGGFVLVDYKTGLAGNPLDWDTARPNDPQLPLYALLHEAGELKGLAFAKVRPGKDMKWHGLQAEAGILPSRSNPIVELEHLIEEWRHTLTRLAEDFAAGDARVRPRDFHIDCARCTQRLLCRVDFAALEQHAPADDLDAAELEPA